MALLVGAAPSARGEAPPPTDPLAVAGWAVTVVGGGDLASAKVRELLAASVDLTLISPESTEELENLARQGRMRWVRRAYEEGDLDGARLVFAAAGDASVNRAVAVAARSRGVPVNVPDDPRHSTFLDPAFFQRGHLTVAVSAGGGGPDLDNRLRRKLELEVPPLYGQVAEILHRYREKALEQIPARKERQTFLRELVAFLDGPEIHLDLAEDHLHGALAGAKALLEKHVQRARAR